MYETQRTARSEGKLISELKKFQEELETAAQRHHVEPLCYVEIGDGESDDLCPEHAEQHRRVHGGQIVRREEEDGVNFTLCAVCEVELSVFIEEEAIEKYLEAFEREPRRHDDQEAYRITQLIRACKVLPDRSDLQARVLALRRILN